MKWIKNAGFTLLFTFSLGFSISSNAAEQEVGYLGKMLGMDQVTALKKTLKEVGIGDDTIQKLIDLVERLRQSGLAITADFNAGLDEAIQGSKELKALNTIQEKIALLIKNIQTFKQAPKSTIAPANQEKEHKRSAAAEAAALSLDSEPAQVEIDKKFIASTVQPVINEIDKALNGLKNNIQQRIAACKKEREQKKETDKKEAAARGAEQAKELSHEASTLSSLADREMALNKIIGRLTIIKQLLSPATLVSPAVSITDTLIKELNTLHKEILENIKPFKGGLAGVLEDLTEGLSNAGKTISTNIGEDLQHNLRAVLGSSEVVTIIENINKWLSDYNPANKANISKYSTKEFIGSITAQIEQLEYLFNNMNQANPEKANPTLGKIIQQFKDALGRYQKAIDAGQAVAAPRALYQSICQTNTELLDYIQGTLANIINMLKKVLFATVDKCTSDLKHNINENIDHFHTRLDKTIDRSLNTDLPRTLKKGVGYLTLGTIAACALCHIIWHDRPWQGHLKNIGIATGSIIGMFLVDPVINYFSKPKPQRG